MGSGLMSIEISMTLQGKSFARLDSVRPRVRAAQAASMSVQFQLLVCSFLVFILNCARNLHSSSGTLCYCDEFCDQHINPDCCPDYETFCKGKPEPIHRVCEVDGVFIRPFEEAMVNCNLW